MSDFGVKVSLPGYNAETAPDVDLYFSSSWPLVKIDTSLSGTVSLTANQVFPINHNLGYPPFTMLWSKASGFRGAIDTVNSNTASFTSLTSDTYRYYICRNPLNQNFQAPNINIQQAQQGVPNPNFGIKFTKPGKNTNSTDFRDYTIHSGTKSLQVHQVIYSPLGTISGDSYNGIHGLKYISDLPYRPVYFAFYSSDNKNFVPLFTTSQTAPKINYDQIDGGIVINDLGGTGGWGVFFTLLDPFQSTFQKNVSI